MSANRKITPRDLAAANRLRGLWDEKARSLDLTQKQAAQQLGMSQSALSQYLNGRLALNTDAILKFADLLHVYPTDLQADVLNKLHNRTSLFNLETRYVPIKKTIKGKKINQEVLVTVPAGSGDIDGYQMEGDAYDPFAMEGDYVLYKRDVKPQKGDRCIMQLVNEIEVHLCKLLRKTTKYTTVEMLDTHRDELRFESNQVQSLHKIYAVISD